ncbi:tripartite tricarboxylate transporter permease [Bacillus piscicola]|uniref:tripartite tricarboxylate transporter permease n=1 Tax=Bacillus piscicola TaxID=1632684 RepID=UPI001F0937ED|nr:tripartite tricarboxylate transporter permease [Bacillus piscicola]
MGSEMLEFFVIGLTNTFTPFNLLIIILALAAGIIVGAVPGLSAAMATALLVPFTFGMSPSTGLAMLAAIGVGAVYGGGNSAILLNTPGTPASVASTFDGYPMSQRGEADKALNTSLISSVIGGIIGSICLMFFSIPLSRIALQLGAPEYFWITIFALTTIASLSQGAVFKGVLSGVIGLLAGMIGLDPITATPRFTFDYYPLMQGIDIIAAMIGLFAFSQMLVLAASMKSTVANYTAKKGIFKKVTARILRKSKLNLTRSSLIGSIVGILPGAGAEIASMVSYTEAKRWSKNSEKYGTGITDGMVASESANNASIGGMLIPTLTLGIPGGAGAAIMMGALLTHGIQPGSKLFSNHGDIVYTFMISFLLANILLLVVGYFLIKVTVKVLTIPAKYVIAGMVVLSVIGTYSLRNSMLDVTVMVIFGVIGFLGKRVGLNNGAIALGLILAPLAESSLVQSLLMASSENSFLQVFVLRPISLVFIILTIVSLGLPSLLMKYKRRADSKSR